MVWEITAFVTLGVALLGVLVYNRRWENRYLKRRTREALSDSLKEEIETEHAQGEARRKLFEEAMKKARADHHLKD